MGKAGLITTKRGYQGGFVLAQPASEITLLDVVKAVEPNEPGSGCLLGLAGCSDANPCPLRRFWQEEWPRIEARLRQETLADAAEFVKGSHGKFTKCPGPNYVPKCGPTEEAAQVDLPMAKTPPKWQDVIPLDP
jgi:DNA-binding IscR family transcriptional regulator